MKSNQNPAVAFFANHVEKLVFGGAVVAMLAIVYFASKTEVLDKTPEQLSQQNDRASAYINQVDAWDSIEGLRKAETRSAELITEASQRTLDPDLYSYDKLMGTRLVTLAQRLDPELFPATDMMSFQISSPIVLNGRYDKMQLRLAQLETDFGGGSNAGSERSGGGAGGLGGFGGGDSGEYQRGGGSDEEDQEPGMVPASLQNVALLNPIAQAWDNDGKYRPYVTHTACVMGLMPFDRQWDEFDSKLRDAQGWYPLRDRPSFAHIEIQRRVDGGDWEDISGIIEQVESAVASYSDSLQPEFADPKYTNHVLTRPILPFMGFDFRVAAVHPKTEEFEFFKKLEQPKSMKLADEPAAPPENKEPKQDDPWGRTGAAEDPFGQSSAANNPPPGQGRGGNAGELGPTDQAAPGKEPLQRPEIRSRTESIEELWSDRAPVQYKLIRFFDPSVQEGLKYQYRVRVWLNDPNNPDPAAVDEDGEFVGMKAPSMGGGAEMPSAGGGAGAGIGGDYEAPTNGGRDANGGSRGAAGGAGADSESSSISLREIEFKELRSSMLDPQVRQRIKSQENAEYLASLPKRKNAQGKLEPISELIFARPTPWSEPTPELEIRPAPAKFFAGTAVSRANRLTMDLVVTKADSSVDATLPTVREVSIGDLLNFTGASRFAHPLKWTLHTDPEVEYDSGAVVVGIQGGDRRLVYQNRVETRRTSSGNETEKYIPSRDRNEYRTIGESLLLDRDGKLVLHTEYGDLDQFRFNTYSRDDTVYGLPELKEVEEEDDDNSGFGGRGGGGGGEDF